jgi:hypothetical protein
MNEQRKYRISFEFVNPISHPQAYRGESPCMRASDVPETWWHHVERESYDLDDVKSQFDGLTSEIAKGELIRNPLIEKTVIAAWEPLQP